MNRRGATLVELMVALALFSSVLVVVLSFYLEANKVNARKERDSKQFRRAIEVMDRIDTRLRNALVFDVEVDFVNFLEPAEPTVERSYPKYSDQGSIIYLLDRKLIYEKGSEQQILAELEPEEQVTFYWQIWKEECLTEPCREIVGVDWIYDGPDNVARDFRYTRTLLVPLF